MNLNERERKIAIGVAITLVLVLLYYVAWEPYSDARDKAEADQAEITRKLDNADQIFHREKVLRPVWVDMQNGGLNVDSSKAIEQTLSALNSWSYDCGFNLATYKYERTTQGQGTFQIINITGSGGGHMPQVARMLADIEMAQIPIRINELSITPAKEGTDDLNVRFSLSALCQPPPGATPAKTGNNNGGGQSS